MFRGVSWEEFFFCLVAAVIVFYLAVWIIYYKAKLPKFKLDGNDESDEFEGNASIVIAEIKNVFKGKGSSTELVYALRNKLENYKHWDEPGFRDAINA